MTGPITLTGQSVRLELLSVAHSPALAEAVCDGELWKLWYTSIPSPEEMTGEIERRLKLRDEGSMLPFAVVSLPTKRIVGMTSFMNIEAAIPRMEIGSTWYARSVQKSALNTEAKLLLLERAFEVTGCLAVELRTHVLNQQSRRAIERLGARLDGILRFHRVLPNGTIRDTCVYSITAPEWPAIKVLLRGKLGLP
ncbi:GNAT family N-acetyltransferase [Acetobacter oeni]|uniref:GCN5 family N-acetyltransferase n=1 Tax=Acetobacter oeni TaxID=304077 RepID=A0A511XGQ1_9PROT|nr:GNAT family protein [Acetobacter oeni]MBB3881703.1 RimJ/RimL family protein N-acetyltransferase [Acetobacter oeni]GBR05969.1 GCN5-related N-acetyltransferase [Acetobacter oeni LMG 21952]GEN62126.1 GCN5 family N-acetyltransferase [Acetobacter oeni]